MNCAPPTTMRVLLVEDDPTIADVVVKYLEREGFAVSHAGDGPKAVELSFAELPDLILLDLMLPGIDGFEVLEKVRARAPVPVIMLTALGEESDRVLGLELGADDYIAKPFSPRELVARVKAVLRRATMPLAVVPTPGATRIHFGDLTIDLGAREASRGGARLALTAREFELLGFLANRPRIAFSRAELFEQVWGYTYGDASTVTVHIRRLREKIEEHPSSPTKLVTVWGSGYRWDG